MNHLDAQFGPELSVSDSCAVAVQVNSAHDLRFCRAFTPSCLRRVLR